MAISINNNVSNDVWPKAPFPEDCPTHPLLVVDFLKIEAGDLAEIETLFKACTSLGFFCKFKLLSAGKCIAYALTLL